MAIASDRTGTPKRRHGIADSMPAFAYHAMRPQRTRIASRCDRLGASQADRLAIWPIPHHQTNPTAPAHTDTPPPCDWQSTPAGRYLDGCPLRTRNPPAMQPGSRIARRYCHWKASPSPYPPAVRPDNHTTARYRPSHTTAATKNRLPTPRNLSASADGYQ